MLWVRGLDRPAKNDRVSLYLAGNLSCSLYFFRVHDVVVLIKDKGSGSNQNQIRGTFSRYSVSYDLVVTIPKSRPFVRGTGTVSISSESVTLL